MKSPILLLTEVFPPKTGGSGRWFWELYRRLPRQQVLILAGECPGHDQFDRGHGLQVLRIPVMSQWGVASLSGLTGYAARVRRARRIVRQHGVEQIHCGRLLPEGWIAWLLRKMWGLPYLSFVHGEELNVGLASREFGWIMRRVLRGAELLVANSHNTADVLKIQWQVPDDRIAVLHPGVDTERFAPAARSATVRAELAWHDRPVVLTVGRLQKRKGQDHLIRALPAIRGTVPNVLYAIVGDGEERTSLEGLVTELGLEKHVQFRGEVGDAELTRCYQQCDLFVLPNREVAGDFEGFGMVLLEAQACAKPVLAGASGGTAETMRIPETGRVVSCDDPAELARAVLALLIDRPLRDRMGEAGRQWVVERFGWDALVRQARSLFGLDGSRSCLKSSDDEQTHGSPRALQRD